MISVSSHANAAVTTATHSTGKKRDFPAEPEENVLPIVIKGATITEMILDKPREEAKAK